MTGFYPRARTNGAFVVHSKKNPCPICDHTDWCRSFEDGWTQCRRKPSDRPARPGGWMHRSDGGASRDWRDDVFTEQPKAPTISFKAKPATLHAVYQKLVDLLALSPEHRAALLARGLTDAHIDALSYRSLPRTGRALIAADLVSAFGSRILGTVPGLYVRHNRNDDLFPTLAGMAGILIPIRNVKREIVGFQIRADDPGAGGKYSWFSSKDKELGCGSGAPIHVAFPIERAGWDMSESEGLTITEGPLKADIAAQYLGSPVLAVPGVGNYAGAIEILEALKKTEAYIAYDMDAATNEQVKRHRDRLAADLVAVGIAPFLTTWDSAYKGLDDALVAGVDAGVQAYPLVLERKSGQIEEIDGSAAAAPIRMLRSVAETRTRLSRDLRTLVARIEPGLTVFKSSTGTGKTFAMAELLADLHRNHAWPQVDGKAKKSGSTRDARMLIAVPTKELARETEALVNGLAGGKLALVMEGRNEESTHEWGCHRPELIHLAGQNRHNPMVDVCMDCKSEYEAIYGPKWSCNYLTMKEVASKRRLVIAPYASLFNASSELRNFDVIIVDEMLLPTITESVVLTTDHVDLWLSEMDRMSGGGQHGVYGLDSAFRRLTNLLKIVIASGREFGHEWTPARDVLLTHCPDLADVLWEIVNLTTDDDREHHRYSFERPYLTTSHQRVPLRLLLDLLPALGNEAARTDGGDSRLWLTPGGLKLFMVRDHLVDILRDRCVINLDATPNPLLRHLFPGMKEVGLDAQPFMHVTQVADALMTRGQLAGEANPLRDRVSTALESATACAAAPVIFTFKGLDANVPGEGPRLRVSNPNAAYGHFDAETRGLNRFQSADVIAIVGRYSSPISELRMLVQGCRFATNPPKQRTEATDALGRPLRLRPYLWVDPAGRGRGRWSIADVDPEVDELVRWSESSTIFQAIGRGRAVLRSQDAPLLVYLFTGNPIADLPIDDLTTLEFVGAPPPNRETPPGFYDARDERNAWTAETNRHRVFEAIAELHEAGQPVTRSGVARISGVSLYSLKANKTLRAIVDQVMSPAAPNDITEGGSPSMTLVVNREAQGLPPSVMESEEADQGVPPQVIDLSSVQEAIQRADHADSNIRRAANDELAARLAAIAELRRHGPPRGPTRGDISHQPFAYPGETA